MGLTRQQHYKSRREIEQLYDLGHAAGEAVRLSTDPKDLASIPTAKLEKAREKLEAVTTGRTDKYSKRSLLRFQAQIAGAATLLDQLIALVDNKADKGNRSERISKFNLNLIEKAIEEGYNTPTRQRKKGAYAKYLGLCEGLDDASLAAGTGPRREESGAPVRPVCRIRRDPGKTAAGLPLAGFASGGNRQKAKRLLERSNSRSSFSRGKASFGPWFNQKLAQLAVRHKLAIRPSDA